MPTSQARSSATVRSGVTAGQYPLQAAIPGRMTALSPSPAHSRRSHSEKSVQMGLTLYLPTGCRLGLRGQPVDGLTVGELAKRAGVNMQTIRYYEREGLLAK